MMSTLKEDFTKIYQKEKWGKGKGSGTGSTPLYCQKYLKYLQSLLQPGMHVLDLGCGDWQLYRGFDWPALNYLGVDVVEMVVDENTRAHPDFRFMCADFSQPPVMELLLSSTHRDIVLIKDVLQHWSDEEIIGWLSVVKQSSFGTLVTVNNWRHFRSPWKDNLPRDIDNPYRWAPIDMTKFGFEVVDYYPAGKFKQIAVLKGNGRDH
jgi:2-polyprenyl-3-methyl-5-hydroxy-6-metoxy-1,4-benzoquinol methylase